jgi:hypothetical protein
MAFLTMNIRLDSMFDKRAATIAFNILLNDEKNIKLNIEVQTVSFLVRVNGILTGWDISQFCCQIEELLNKQRPSAALISLDEELQMTFSSKSLTSEVINVDGRLNMPFPFADSGGGLTSLRKVPRRAECQLEGIKSQFGGLTVVPPALKNLAVEFRNYLAANRITIENPWAG